MNQNILFPDNEAITKYNIDKNGLYLNDELGYKGYTSPYLGVVKSSENTYIPEFHITKKLFNVLKENSQIKLCIQNGLDYFNVYHNFPIQLPRQNDARNAAYLAQLFRFGDNLDNLITNYFLHIYVSPDEEVEKILTTFPDWEFQAVTSAEYDPKAKEYKIHQDIISEAEAKLQKEKKRLSDMKRIKANEEDLMKRMAIYAKKIGYEYEEMTLELAKKLMNMRINDFDKAKIDSDAKYNKIMKQKENEFKNAIRKSQRRMYRRG